MDLQSEGISPCSSKTYHLIPKQTFCETKIVTTTTWAGFGLFNLIADIQHGLMAFIALEPRFKNAIIIINDPHPKRIAIFATAITKIDPMLEI